MAVHVNVYKYIIVHYACTVNCMILYALMCRAPVHSIATQVPATGMYANKVYLEESTALLLRV